MQTESNWTSWYQEIDAQMVANGDQWENVVQCTLTPDDLHVRFDPDYGRTNGRPFTVWTHDWVYFPACYDGSEWAACVPRNPNGKLTNHVGGG